MAMSIGGENHPGAVTEKHLRTLADDLEVGYGLVRDTALETAENLNRALPDTVQQFQQRFGDSPILERIPAIVQRRTRKAIPLLK